MLRLTDLCEMHTAVGCFVLELLFYPIELTKLHCFFFENLLNLVIIHMI